MKVLPLNKVDVTHRKALEPGITWLIEQGYRLKMSGGRVLLVRSL